MAWKHGVPMRANEEKRFDIVERMQINPHLTKENKLVKKRGNEKNAMHNWIWTNKGGISFMNGEGSQSNIKEDDLIIRKNAIETTAPNRSGAISEFTNKACGELKTNGRIANNEYRSHFELKLFKGDNRENKEIKGNRKPFFKEGCGGYVRNLLINRLLLKEEPRKSMGVD